MALRMLYLIGGASRAGKTLVAQQLLEKYAIPRFSVDYLITALQKGAPDLGIHHDQKRQERSERVWPYLKPLLCNLLHEEPSYTVEGDALLPKLIRELIDENPERVRACFLGYPRIELEQKLKAVVSFTGRINNWTSGMSAVELEPYICEGIKDSREIEIECKAANLSFFDISRDFEAGINLAVDYLVN